MSLGYKRSSSGFKEYPQPLASREFGSIRVHELNFKKGFEHQIVMNTGSVVLSAMEIGLQPALIIWEPEQGVARPRHFRLIPSNHQIPADTWPKLAYIGTVYIREPDTVVGESVIIHVFEDKAAI